MNGIRKYADLNLTYEYDVDLRRLYPTKDINSPFGSAYVHVKAGEKTKNHNHHEQETFLIISGSGILSVDGKIDSIEAGDVIYLESYTDHFIYASNSEDVHFLSIWWEEDTNKSSKNTAKNIIFTPPPTPNGDLHLGHISGPYISADIVKRFLQKNNRSVDLIVGTDKHQSYVELKSKQEKTLPSEIYNNFTKSIFETFDKASVSYDYIHDCDSEYHKVFVSNFIQLMLDKKLLKIEKKKALKCDSCQHELFDGLVVGTCRECGSSSNGCVCEDCGSSNNGYDLISPKCNVCGEDGTVYEVEKGVLDLKKCRSYFNQAQSMINVNEKLFTYINAQNILMKDDFVVTYDSEWGLPLEQKEFKGQVVLCWIEMVAGYLASLSINAFQEEILDVKEVIRRINKSNLNVIHLMGFDNSFYYAYLYPLILAALGLEKMNISFVTNEFLLLDEKKFSTSRGHAIWANDAFSSPEITGWYRFYLSINRPEFKRENYNLEEFNLFKSQTDEKISLILSTHKQRLSKFFSNIDPLIDTGVWDKRSNDFFEYFNSIEKKMNCDLSVPMNFSTKSLAMNLMELIGVTQNFQNMSAHMYVDLTDFNYELGKTYMVLEARAVKLICFYLECIAPILFKKYIDFL